MKSESAEQVETAGAGGDIADPFAVDLFAASRARDAPAAPGATDAPRPEDFQPSTPEQPWHAALPKISRDEARLSRALAAAPPLLSEDAREALARVLARLARVRPEDIRLDSLGLHETTLSGLAAQSLPGRILLALSVEPEGAPVVLAPDADFASSVVDRLLGGEGAPPDALRGLSATERAVIEFLCLSVVRELNELAGEPVFRLEAVADALAPKLAARLGARAGGQPQTAPAQGAAPVAPHDARLLVVTVRVAVGETVGLARLILNEAALAALSAAENPLLARALRGGARSAGRLGVFKKFAGDVALRLLVGETHLDARNLADLEPGDIVIVERQLVAWDGGRIAGQLSLRAGAGRGFVVNGRARAQVTEEGGAVAAGGGERLLALAVESVAGGGRAEAERVEMEDEGRLEEGDEGAAALEGLLLTLRVELAARRISLEELSRLRAGQILELGCRATDPVELVADGRPVATGELVDIEGRLGVRVTRLTG